MKIYTKQDIEIIASKTKFIKSNIEKAIRLIDILSYINTIPSRCGRFVLKGGTAINLCVLNMPRAYLNTIKTPALVIGAEYDTMDPAYMQWMSKQLVNGSYLYCPQGSHMAMWDDPEVYHNGIKKFINEV